MMRVFMERTGIRPDVAAGLSLGEYPAMAAAGVMSDEMPSVPYGREVS